MFHENAYTSLDACEEGPGVSLGHLIFSFSLLIAAVPPSGTLAIVPFVANLA